VPAKINAQEAKLAQQVIDTFQADLDVSTFRDDYQAELRRVIDAKIAGQEIVTPVEQTPAKVVDLMEALRKSLDSVSAGKKKPAHADLPTAKAVAAPKAAKVAKAVAEASPPARAVAAGGRKRARL